MRVGKSERIKVSVEVLCVDDIDGCGGHSTEH